MLFKICVGTLFTVICKFLQKFYVDFRIFPVKGNVSHGSRVTRK